MSDVAQLETVSEIDGLEVIASQADIRVNEGSRAHVSRFGWAISPNIERAKAAREKPAPQPPLTVAPAVERPPARRMPPVARMISDYSELVEAVRDRVDELGLTRHELDHQAGLPTGYSGKVLGPRQVKAFGRTSLGPTLGAIGCRLILIEDPEQTAKIRARMKPRERAVRQTQSVNDGLPTIRAPGQ